MKHKQTGLIEVCSNISITPTTEGHFLISELNPRPEIREPLVKNNTWYGPHATSDVGGSNK
jgi:hypothetical protein|nr:hypothetical protein [uncultured Emticicia sp.]